MYKGFAFLVADDVKFPECRLGVGHHVADGHPDGFGHHPDGLGIVHGQTRLHAYLIAVAIQIDVYAEVGVYLLSYGLHGTHLAIGKHDMLLHVGYCHEVEYDTGLHAEVGTEMSKGVDAIADGAHQLATQALDKIDNPLRGIGIDHKGYRLHKHADAAPQPLVHTAVVDGSIGYLLLTGKDGENVAESGLEQQVRL